MNFSAAHFIPHPAAGKCQQLHGHTYTVNVTVAGNMLDELGFLTNFQELKKLVHGRYDHTLLNEHPEFAHRLEDLKEGVPAPSTEELARMIAERIQDHLDTEGNEAHCVQVVVRETPTSYVSYRPPLEVITSTLYSGDGFVEQQTSVVKPEVAE
ncbi:6-carboxy-5,6,7,8-tetrahydropterin synthase [compost metagenome]